MSFKVYTYPAAVYGQGGCRLVPPLAEPVDRPELADVLVLPQTVCTLAQSSDLWARFWDEPEVRRRPECLVCYDASDAFNAIPVHGALYFRAGGSAIHQRQYPTMVPWPWNAPNLGWATRDCLGADRRYPVTFQGWKTPLDLTERAVASCVRAFGASACHVAVYHNFHGYCGPSAGNHREGEEQAPGLTGNATDGVSREEAVRREAEYRRGLREAELVLAPQSIIGVPRYRVYEAQSAGRLPVWIGNETLPPLADKVNWDRIAIRIDAADVDWIGDTLFQYLMLVPLAERRAREHEAQAAYREWFDPARVPENMTRVVAERLGFLQ